MTFIDVMSFSAWIAFPLAVILLVILVLKDKKDDKKDKKKDSKETTAQKSETTTAAHKSTTAAQKSTTAKRSAAVKSQGSTGN